jgi:hypothetical protein
MHKVVGSILSTKEREGAMEGGREREKQNHCITFKGIILELWSGSSVRAPT